MLQMRSKNYVLITFWSYVRITLQNHVRITSWIYVRFTLENNVIKSCKWEQKIRNHYVMAYTKSLSNCTLYFLRYAHVRYVKSLFTNIQKQLEYVKNKTTF